MAPKGPEPLRPSLPASLLKEIGDDTGRNSEGSRDRRLVSRKERRKEERVQKRQRSSVVQKSHGRGRHISSRSSERAQEKRSPEISKESPKGVPKPKSKKAPQPAPDDEFDGFSEESEDEQPSKAVISMATKDKLSRDDAEIAELERKLGIKKRKTLPKSFQEDGLEELFGDLADEDDEDDGLSAKRKRKAEADKWLAQKRRKATLESDDESNEEGDGLEGLDDVSDLASEDELDEAGGEEDSENDDIDSEDLGSGAEEEEDEGKPVRKRENPYVAPTPASASAQKYVPPARRQESGADAEVLSRIRRQTQGLINRLTESNLVAILGDIEQLYRDYPRQHVTSILVDLLLVQICEPTSLPDTLLILNAGFSTAVYKVIGPDFGAQLVQQTVERFKAYYAQVPEDATQNVSKHTSNLITFLSEMYNFQLIGCNLIFDYIRFLLNDLSEHNAELLLRVVRMAGQLLRHDDPLALKDIVALIRPAVKKVGEDKLSVRTKFMIENINDLKNNKMKAGASASAVVQEHTTRMKKLLGSLNTRKLKATEALRIGLRDIEESDKRGKWWLVGASWSGRGGGSSGIQGKDEAAADDDEADSIVLNSDDEALPDLAALAREQNMNTDVRRSIFIAIMSASDYEDAYARLMKLRLNKDRQKEIAYVMMHCAGAEQQYNPYYALIARRLCGDRRVRFSFQDSLWKFFRRLGESTFGEDADEDEKENEAMDVRRIFSIGKMFGSLVAHGALGLSILRCLNMAYLRSRTQNFVEVMLITVFLEVSEAGNDVVKMFGAVADLPELSKGLQYFLQKKIKKSDLVEKKDAKKVSKGCKVAIRALTVPDATDPPELE